MNAPDLVKLTCAAAHTLQHLAIDLLYPLLAAEILQSIQALVGLNTLEISAVSDSRHASPHDYDPALHILAHALDSLCARQLRHVTLGDVFATSVVVDSLVGADIRLRLHSLRLFALPQLLGTAREGDYQLRASSVAAMVKRCDRAVGLRRLTLPIAMWTQSHSVVLEAAELHGAAVAYDPARRLR